MTKLTSRYSVQNEARLQAQLSPFSASPRRDGHRGSESGQVGAKAIECELMDDLLSASECKALGEGIFRSREVVLRKRGREGASEPTGKPNGQ